MEKSSNSEVGAKEDLLWKHIEASGNEKLRRWYLVQIEEMKTAIKSMAQARKDPQFIAAAEYVREKENKAIEILLRLKPAISEELLDTAIDARFDRFVTAVVENDLMVPGHTSLFTSISVPPHTKSFKYPLSIPKPKPYHSTSNFTYPFTLDIKFNSVPKEILEKLKLRTYIQADATNKVEKAGIRTAYHPSLEEPGDSFAETGRENKIGGHTPYFEEGDKWPLQDKRPLAFFAQFVDPRRREADTLVQIWMPDVIEEMDLASKRAQIIFKKKSDKPQKIIPEPPNLPNQTFDYFVNDKAIKGPIQMKLIMSWTKTNEINPETLAHLYEDDRTKWDAVHDFAVKYHLDFDDFKLGGFGNSMQGIIYTDAYQNIYAGRWGDSGSIHSDEAGVLEGDMG